MPERSEICYTAKIWLAWGLVMQHGDISGNRAPPEGSKLTFCRGTLFAVAVALLYSLFPVTSAYSWTYPPYDCQKAIAWAQAHIPSNNKAFDFGCEAFVHQAEDFAGGRTFGYCSAQDHWNNAANSGYTGCSPGGHPGIVQSGMAHYGLTGIQPGDIIFFKPHGANYPYGHVGIYAGGGKYYSGGVSGLSFGYTAILTVSSTSSSDPVEGYYSCSGVPACDPDTDPTCPPPPPGGGGAPPTPGTPGGGCCENSGAVLTNGGGAFTVDPCKVVSTPTGLSCPKP